MNQSFRMLQNLGFQIPLNGGWETDTNPEKRSTQVTTRDIVLYANRLNPMTMRLVRSTIRNLNLKVYILMVSHDGRGEQALYTGLAAFQGLEDWRGDFQFRLGYQGNPKSSQLCQRLHGKDIDVYAVDQREVLDSNRKIVIKKDTRGKAENLIKSLKYIAQETIGRDPRDVFVVTTDDDYVLGDPTNLWAMVAPWVLSRMRQKEIPIKKLRPLWNQCHRVRFTKGGSSRLHLPESLVREVIEDIEPVLSYRRLVELVLRKELAGVVEGSEIKDALHALRRIPSEAIVTPINLKDLIGSPARRGGPTRKIIEQVMEKHLRVGGRVSSFLMDMFTRQAEDPLSRALARFTYPLHGDQGATLENWMKLCIGRGYALEITFLIQALMDAKFRGQRICNVVCMPHAHQPQPAEVIRKMKNQILSCIDLLRCLYGMMPPDLFRKRYGQNGTRVGLRRYLASGRMIEDEDSEKKEF